MSDEDTKKTVELNLPASFSGRAANAVADAEAANPEPETRNPEPAKPSSILVKIERVEREDGPLIRMPYEDGSGSTPHYDFAPEKNTFEVPVIVADAAVATGFFRAVE